METWTVWIEWDELLVSREVLEWLKPRPVLPCYHHLAINGIGMQVEAETHGEAQSVAMGILLEALAAFSSPVPTRIQIYTNRVVEPKPENNVIDMFNHTPRSWRHASH